MKTVEEMTYHPTSEKLVDVLCEKAENSNPLFFRVLVAYYMSEVAAMMRCQINTPDRGKIPVNMYAINLMTSGAGKGRSTNVMEEDVLSQFRYRFEEETFPMLAEKNLPILSLKRATRKGVDPDEELERTRKEFESTGPYEVSFNSATESAIKQQRHKLLMANAGSLNFTMDEIGSNLTGSFEAFAAFLELFDVGKIKNSLRKNTNDSKRVETINGRTPTNMLLFGTPSKLLDGGKTEEAFYELMDTGYARRCFWGYIKGHTPTVKLTPEEAYDRQTAATTSDFLEETADRFGALADLINANKELVVTKPVALLFIEYRQNCEELANDLPEHEDLKKAELRHRYFKALKLAGAYAFFDGCPEITEDHAYYAIKLAEESGDAFDRLLTRDRPYVKLAKYIASVGRQVTQADLHEDLPFYRGAISAKQEMMQLAIAHGYQNNILIKKSFNDGIEFLRGETLQPTDLEKIRVSYSNDVAHGYKDDFAPFDQLHKLTQNAGLHWVNHHLKDGHRNEDNAIPGFDMVVIDVDGGVNLSTAQMLLKDYKALYYTTKRHTDQDQRFRIIMPTNYSLSLDAKDYKEFMSNIFSWLPFEVDLATNQRARKWLSHNGHYAYQDGELLDVLPFIPKTSKNEVRKKRLDDQQSLDNLERWVINNTGDGNRNNQLLRYAYILVDAGFDFDGIRRHVVALNDKLPDKLDEAEILGTIMVTVGKALAKK